MGGDWSIWRAFYGSEIYARGYKTKLCCFGCYNMMKMINTICDMMSSADELSIWLLGWYVIMIPIYICRHQISEAKLEMYWFIWRFWRFIKKWSRIGLGAVHLCVDGPVVMRFFVACFSEVWVIYCCFYTKKILYLIICHILQNFVHRYTNAAVIFFFKFQITIYEIL